MSASLVGSEMCIRDSMDGMLLVDCEPGFLNRVSTEYAARRAFGLEPVSYTHLTLPTICSV
eukprot:11698862-Alexandrium_andersonii.AAC.1